ncbi:muconolactone Delta-isomerase family protein [Rhodococcus koreensis]|uniref:Muconolactone delta-isomerase n=1 Tax=Rhodococcus koreensis TaxID=99653 RepID=A0A1H4XL37_9NOCA|nr:muconolactone Delta-isomerase family protein [Rhodococcus koreensis]SED06336.1 Muconolactone delta-isomerase [Rhodococcus koreensis]
MKFHVDARFVEGKDPAPEMAAELARVNELRDAGIIEQLIRRTDNTGAYLILDATDAAAVKEALDSLPFARSATMTFAVDAVEIL